MARLKVSEIFHSIQGESTFVGLPTVFVRLTGCPLRCGYCDTSYAFQGGEWWNFDELLDQITGFHASHVTVTGGEPLAQKSCIPFLRLLCEEGYQVSLETSGALDISEVDPRVKKVMDIKTPASGEVSKNRFENLDSITGHDEIKFVIGDEHDYEWAKDCIKQYQLFKKCTVLFSPSYQVLESAQLAEWLLRDRLPVRLQLQLHKVIWGEAEGR